MYFKLCFYPGLNVFDIDQHEIINYNNDIRLNELLEFMRAKTKEQALEIIKKFQRNKLFEMEEEMEKFFDYDAWIVDVFSKDMWADAIREENFRIAKNKELRAAKKEAKKAGRMEGIFETAKNMLNDNINIKSIMKYTGLTEKEIENLK